MRFHFVVIFNLFAGSLSQATSENQIKTNERAAYAQVLGDCWQDAKQLEVVVSAVKRDQARMFRGTWQRCGIFVELAHHPCDRKDKCTAVHFLVQEAIDNAGMLKVVVVNEVSVLSRGLFQDGPHQRIVVKT